MPNVNWNDYAKEASSSEGNSTGFIFPQEGKTVIKLYASGMNDTSWFEKYTSVYEYQGKEQKSLKYAVYAIDMSKPSVERTVEIAVLPKSAMSSIFNALVEEHDLLTPETGKPVSITRTKDGGKTTYTVLPTAKSYDSTFIEIPEDMMTLAEAIKDGVIINRCHCRDVVNASEREKSPLTEKGRTKIRKALNSNKELSRKAMDEM